MCRYQIFALRHHTRDAPKANPPCTRTLLPGHSIHQAYNCCSSVLITLIVQNNMSSHTTPAHIPPSIPSHMQPGNRQSHPPPNVTSCVNSAFGKSFVTSLLHTQFCFFLYGFGALIDVRQLIQATSVLLFSVAVRLLST